MAEGPRDALGSTEKKLAVDLDIHPRSSQLLLLNSRTAYHFLLNFVDSCFNVFRTAFKTLLTYI